jgi:acyl transferase domain-containing protein/acyl carrier protein
MKSTEEIRESDVAIIAMSCRFPGSDTIEGFWRNLREGRDSLTFFSDEQLAEAGVDAETLREGRYVKAGQVIADVDTFDAELFGITPDEAELLDPQQRKFLECALEVLERAGYDPGRYGGRIGVFAGVGMNGYMLRNLGDRYRASSLLDQYRLMLTNDKDYLPTRVSYRLNLRGPAVNVNTACSTSLVATHMACLSLLSGDCDMALVGSTHIKVPQVAGYLHQEGMIFSPDGRCRAFDAKAQGTVIGSGVGVVLLKRLRDAWADGDWIHAVVKGTAVNNDGAAKACYTAPSVAGQAAVVMDALAAAGCPADTISYVEAHGTGTALGDPVEVAALTDAFAPGTRRTGYCALGSVKTNLGHLDTAAGMAGLIKTALMLENRTLVPSLHFETPNPEINFAASPFYVNTELREWTAGAAPLRAGVSSFGIGGTNAHVVLQEPPVRAAPAHLREHQLVVLSARSPEALESAAVRLARHLKQHPDLAIAAVAQTLSLGRRAHRHRRALVCRDSRDAALALALGDAERLISGQAEEGSCEAVFVLTGRQGGGGQHALSLLARLPVFRAAAERCAAELGAAAEVGALLQAEDELAAFVVQYATAEVLASWGVRPAAVAGAGTGELVGAHLAGVLPLATALRLARAGSAGGVVAGSIGKPAIPLLTTRTGRWLGELRDEDLAALPAGTARLPVRLQPGGGEDRGLPFLLGLLGRLWTQGARIDWLAVHAGEEIRRVPLPTYPFERWRYWIEPAGREPAAREPGRSRLLARLASADDGEKVGVLADFLRREIARVLGTVGGPLAGQPVDLDASLFDLGLDSLVLIEIAAKLTDELHLAVPSSSFVEYPTVRAFTNHLAERMGFRAVPDRAEDRGRTSRRAARAAAHSEGRV